MLRISTLVPLTLFSLALIPGAHGANANLPENPPEGVTDLLAEKAALVVEADGEVHVPAASFSITVRIDGDGKTKEEAAAACASNIEKANTALKRMGMSPLSIATPDANHAYEVKVTANGTVTTFLRVSGQAPGYFEDLAMARTFIQTLRSASISGNVGVQLRCGKSRANGYLDALHVAAQNAGKRAVILAEVAKPRIAESIGVRERDQERNGETDEYESYGYDLTGNNPILPTATAPVTAHVTVYYTFKDAPTRPAAKPIAQTKKPAAKTATKPVVKPVANP